MAKFLRLKVRGIEEAINYLDQTDENIKNGVIEGLEKASEYLCDTIKNKFGVYQSGWRKLKYETVVRERKKGFGSNASKPLMKTGAMKESIKIKNTTSTGRKVTSTLYSNDEKLIHHIFGAPRRNVPKRDPVLITVKEEEDHIAEIIEKSVFGEE